MQVTDESNGADEDLADSASDGGDLPIHHRFRLNLERLGHAEFFRKDFPNGWRVVPPTLACVQGSERFLGVVCGARTDRLMERLRNAGADAHIENTAQVECPDRIAFISEDQSALQRLAIGAGVCCQPNAPGILLAAIPPIDDLQIRSVAELPHGEDWETHQFSATTLGWEAVKPREARKASFGLYRFLVHFERQYFLRLNKATFTLPVQVGKYIVLKSQRRCIVSYDSTAQALSMPVSARPPLLIDRALTLCSGLIPGVQGGRLAYRNVSQKTAHMVFALLRQ